MWQRSKNRKKKTQKSAWIKSTFYSRSLFSNSVNEKYFLFTHLFAILCFAMLALIILYIDWIGIQYPTYTDKIGFFFICLGSFTWYIFKFYSEKRALYSLFSTGKKNPKLRNVIMQRFSRQKKWIDFFSRKESLFQPKFQWGKSRSG